MSRHYTYYHEFNENEELIWYVFEKATAQVVAEFFFEDDAKEWSNFWSNGGGFAGFTPRFVLTKVSKGDINEAFLAEFAE
jgi:hypothetical protein